MKLIDLTVLKAKKYGSFCELETGGKFEPSVPGQFYMLKGDDWDGNPLLPRPISVMDEDAKAGKITFLIKDLGEGSKRLMEIKAGGKLKATGPLGNHFPVENISKGDEVLLIGGGVGVPPLYYLLQKLTAEGFKPIFLEGAKVKEELLLLAEIKKLGVTPVIATEDGSVGIKGFVTEAAKKYAGTAGAVFACGPRGMLKAVSRLFDNGKTRCFISLEERMACGYGVCLGCAVGIKDSEKEMHFDRVCVEGPVFDSRVVIWE